jgi:hypothetical protein
MGGCLNSRAFFNPDREKIKKKWAQLVEDSLYERGHSYSGDIGMLGYNIAAWHDKKFSSRREAENWLANNHEKWQPGIAVSFKISDDERARANSDHEYHKENAERYNDANFMAMVMDDFPAVPDDQEYAWLVGGWCSS